MISKSLQSVFPGSTLCFFDETDSTNDRVKENREQKEGYTVIARRQTKGRGRGGRTFLSPEGGLYMSMLLRPQSDRLLSLTAMAAVAVAETAETFTHERVYIKWVNDLYFHQKKVCGILTEGVFDPDPCMILGIGVNLFAPQTGFDRALAPQAGSLFDRDTGIREEFCALLIQNFGRYYHGQDPLPGYRKRSYLDGRKIAFSVQGKPVSGTVKGIDNDFGLLVETENGVLCLRSGEVEKVFL